jgi:hypothetical protein
MHKNRCNFYKKLLILSFYSVCKMAVKACEVGDQVKCKTNVNKTGVVTSIEREKGSTTKVYHVKWDSAQCSILVPKWRKTHQNFESQGR